MAHVIYCLVTVPRFHWTALPRACHILWARGGLVRTVRANMKLNPGCIFGDSGVPTGFKSTASRRTVGSDAHLHILACRCAVNQQRTSGVSLTRTL